MTVGDRSSSMPTEHVRVCQDAGTGAWSLWVGGRKLEGVTSVEFTLQGDGQPVVDITLLPGSFVSESAGSERSWATPDLIIGGKTNPAPASMPEDCRRVLGLMGFWIESCTSTAGGVSLRGSDGFGCLEFARPTVEEVTIRAVEAIFGRMLDAQRGGDLWKARLDIGSAFGRSKEVEAPACGVSEDQRPLVASPSDVDPDLRRRVPRQPGDD